MGVLKIEWTQKNSFFNQKIDNLPSSIQCLSLGRRFNKVCLALSSVILFNWKVDLANPKQDQKNFVHHKSSINLMTGFYSKLPFAAVPLLFFV